MKHAAIDIIVPVWNRPIETRNCLVNLINYSPDARLVMVDNGSDRETEKLLQEFSEGLEERAFLLRNDVNQGLVKALNRGLEKGEAEFLLIVKNTSIVSPGWLDPLLAFAGQRKDAGLIVPRLVLKGKGKVKEKPGSPCEVSQGSFAAMLIRKSLYDAVGGFDEEMDGGGWCLRDYSRRACRAGFLTFLLPGSEVLYEEDVQLGSETRRRENLQRTIAEFRRRWGQDSSYCLLMPDGADPAVVRSRIEVLLPAARSGSLFQILVPSRLYKELIKSGHCSLHENIVIHVMPFFHTAGTMSKAASRIVAAAPETIVVAGIDGMSYKGDAPLLPFAELETRIRRCDD
ncbi:glycosyltransferase [Geotalea sp. SG265]|uniref:glycosyltransferase family 2 protein n=1 Tax=Geotalea sp. SG265 TaxID=2922867 RepID=UPI001FAF54FC|nr:glycosyltransferase [Geotalea sp. SG265]